MSSLPSESVLLYDGLCGFCDATVQFILARDTTSSMKFAPLQGEYARSLLARHSELASVDSLMLVLPAHEGAVETVLVRSAAVIAIGRYLGGAWRFLSALLRLLPVSVRDLAYDALARRRFRLIGRRDSCRIPSVAQHERFID